MTRNCGPSAGINSRPLATRWVDQPWPLSNRFTYNPNDQALVNDITYIRNHEGLLYLAVVIDLRSRLAVG